MALRLDYRCLLDAFEDYYYHKEIQRMVAETSGATAASPASSASSTASISSASCSSGPSTSSNASSTSSSHSTLAQVAAARAAAALADQQVQLASQRAMFYNVQHPQQLEHLEQLHALQAESGHQQQHPQASADPNASSMANSLLWQPWRDLQQAAAMHHQLYRQQQQQLQLHSEMRATSKVLTTTKWRRERRQRSAGYQPHEAGSSERDRERDRDREDRDMDSPIDMSVTTGALKQRASPPPPYREPLPGTNYAANSRPSVITQAPPKREPPEQAQSDMAMCDIDEHFRRSLGENYAALIAKKSPTPTPTPTPSPSGTPKQQISPLAYGPPSSTSTVASLHYQQHRSPLPKPGLVILEPESQQPELPPPQEEPLPLSLALHRTQTPPSPPPSATGSAPPLPTAVSQVMETAVAARRILDTPHHTPPRYNTPPPPPPAYGIAGNTTVVAPTLTPTPTPNPTPSQIPTPTPSMPAIIRVKAEPGLAAVAASSTQTPPASPTSSTNISIFTKTEASVDDHFAKALGETWKKLQGGHKE
ncbi:uncharacterized protein Dyak_GE21976, isoform D [Drosophila yakuba]|uniref:Uncharacterized protein, isoform D n=1 Tax=Drosophila yakuba TaxID=7245 RepID=B4PHG5_DROYA|nr:uncharacterized protein Dyak_GE21976, isoform D [Drosophila yakuba]